MIPDWPIPPGVQLRAAREAWLEARRLHRELGGWSLDRGHRAHLMKTCQRIHLVYSGAVGALFGETPSQWTWARDAFADVVALGRVLEDDLLHAAVAEIRARPFQNVVFVVRDEATRSAIVDRLRREVGSYTLKVCKPWTLILSNGSHVVVLPAAATAQERFCLEGRFLHLVYRFAEPSAELATVLQGRMRALETADRHRL